MDKNRKKNPSGSFYLLIFVYNSIVSEKILIIIGEYIDENRNRL